MLASPPCARSVLLMWPRELTRARCLVAVGLHEAGGASHLAPSLMVLLNSDLK